jgi:ABC-type sugar transport system permease subunit
MLLPALIGSLFVHIYPTLDAIRMSFFDIQLLRPGRPFAGLQNYATILADPTTSQVIGNTIVWTLFSLIFGSIIGLFAAVKLNKPYPGRGFLRALFLVPWVTPPYVVANVFRWLVSETFSPINNFLLNIGLIERPINFLGNIELILWGMTSVPALTLIAINVWSIFSFMMVMFLAGLQTIDTSIYEAARIDGASNRQIFFRITLPLLLPVVETVILLQGIWQFNNFNLSFLVTRGGPLNLTSLASVRVYSEAFINFRYGTAAALSVIMLLIILVPAVIYMRRSLKSYERD